MRSAAKWSILLASGLAFAQGALASFESPPITMSRGCYCAEFVTSGEGDLGAVYFLGSQSEDGPITYAASDDAYGVGRLLFDLGAALPGDRARLGSYDEGVTLHFAWRIGEPDPETAPVVVRTDAVDDLAFFSFAILEDEGGAFTRARLADPGFADSLPWLGGVVFDVRTCGCAIPETPAPGGAAIALLGAGVLGIRPRRAAH